MKVRKLSVFLAIALVIVFTTTFVLFASSGGEKGGKKLTGELTIFWAEWDPANYLHEAMRTTSWSVTPSGSVGEPCRGTTWSSPTGSRSAA
jgi:hypothetical protein